VVPMTAQACERGSARLKNSAVLQTTPLYLSAIVISTATEMTRESHISIPAVLCSLRSGVFL
jgi:hypothetical protein